MKKTILLFTACIYYSLGISQGSDWDAYMEAELKKFKIPGAAILVIKNGKVLAKKNYGIYSIEFDLPVSDSSIFPLASVTKIITGTLVMKLAENKVLSLDQPVIDFMDSLPEEWKKIKIRHLLSHTSGMVNHFMTRKARVVDPPPMKTIKDAILLSASEPLRFTPGDKFNYSVTGYMFLGYIIEKVTGKPIDKVAKEMIFDPLRMSSTAYGDYKAIIPNRNSLVYTYQNGPFETWNFTYGLSGTTAAGLNTTTTDLSKFLIALDGGMILKKETMKEMMSPVLLNDGNQSAYGLGWWGDKNEDKIIYGHEGGGCAWVDYYPSEHLSIVVLCNLTGSKADGIVKGLGKFFLN